MLPEAAVGFEASHPVGRWMLMHYTYFLARRFWPLVFCALCACKGERANPLPDLDGPEGGSGGGGGRGASGGGGGSGGSAGSSGSAGAGGSIPDAGTDGGLGNCGAVTCRGAGKCQLDAEGVASCVCDSGYVLSVDECIVDETCMQLRILEEGCRQRTGAEPALGILFGLETCASTTVRPDLLGNVAQAFKVLEDGHALGEESYATLLQRDVESYVAIALDLSESLQQDANTLVPLIGRLKTMVQSLAPAQGDPPVNVSLIVFGRNVQTAHPFTTDLAAVVATLDGIQANPLGAISDPGGTNLFGAINYGMAALATALTQRYDATLGAVVATGTLVTITDGKDTSGVTLAKIDTHLNLISIGISSDIDDTELTRVGPQGSFLAPTQTDWTSAFERVSQRVAEYPRRAYLYAYCSPAVAGNHEVSITLAARTPRANATCNFSGTEFGENVACNEPFISNYCSSRSCGTFLACGLCSGQDGGAPPTVRALDDQWDFSKSN